MNIHVINKAAVSGEWTPTAINELDNLIKDIEDGKINYQRFPKEATGGWIKGGRANEAASILVRASKSTSREIAFTVAERYERDKREQPVQERIVEEWAKAVDLWHDNLDTINGKKKLAEGGEAKVFYNDGDVNVTKIISTDYFITPQFALDRITLHNTLFPAAYMEVVGFGRDSDGEFQFLVEQPFIQGEPATQAEIDKFITMAGFEKSDEDWGHTFITEDFYVSDLHDENVIKVGKGIFIVIDADLRLNTPDLDRNGRYEIDNYLAFYNIEDIMPIYRGLLIYSDEGTGKPNIVDNDRVFDSNYLLGTIIGVSTETAENVFKTLPSEEKDAIYKQYRDAIKDEIAKRHYVLTSDENLLENADVVVRKDTPLSMWLADTSLNDSAKWIYMLRGNHLLETALSNGEELEDALVANAQIEDLIEITFRYNQVERSGIEWLDKVFDQLVSSFKVKMKSIFINYFLY